MEYVRLTDEEIADMWTETNKRVQIERAFGTDKISPYLLAVVRLIIEVRFHRGHFK